MRILTLANHLGSRGGLERTQMTNCRGLAARGCTVDVLYVSAGDFFEEWSGFAGTMVRIEGSLPRRRSPLKSGTGVLRALRAGARLAPDLLYVYRYWDLPLAVAISRLSGAPVVFHLCLPPPTRVPRWLGVALRRVDRTLSVSADTARRWAGTGLSPERTEVVLTGIDLERYLPADAELRTAARSDIGVAPDDSLVLYAGRIGREKGVDVLVRAVRSAAEKHGNVHLVVVGSPSLGADPADSARYEDELRALAEDAPVTFLPGRADVVPLLQAADVAVVPSLWPEPLSRALMEPLACGVPVIATDVGGNPEVLTGWLARFLVPPSDPGALAERLAEVCRWRRDEPDLGSRCRAHAESALAVGRETDDVARAIQEAASASSRRSRRRSRTSKTERRS